MSAFELYYEDNSELVDLLEKMVKLSLDSNNRTVSACLNGVRLYADSKTTISVISPYYEDKCKQIKEVEKIKAVVEKLHNLMSVGDSK